MGSNQEVNLLRYELLFIFVGLISLTCLIINTGKTNDRDKSNNTFDDTIKENEPIHLAFVCGGHNATRALYTLIKSILFYRTNFRLVLHIFVDDIAREILEKLFHTWHVPNLDVNYYNVTNLMNSVTWIPNDHYSGVFGLVKLVAPLMLAKLGVDRVIFLDTDMLVMGDIAILHSQFGNESLWQTGACGDPSEEPFIGLVENQSDWYEEDPKGSLRPPPWRAVGRGFNTGVMLIVLSRLKNSSWEETWRDVAFDELVGGRSYVQLADQDIVNLVIKLNRNFVTTLNCKFNLQLNDNTDLDRSCPGHQNIGASSFRLAHWNSPYKLQTKNTQGRHYRKWHDMFENISGDLLREEAQPDQCLPDRNGMPASCAGIRPMPHEQLRTYVNFLDLKVAHGGNSDVTLATHLSFDRIWALDELAANWPGPISAAIYLREAELSSFHGSIEVASALARRRNIGYHLVFKDHGQSYPINKLRNLALEQTLTPYVYLSDVDFVPSSGLYGYLQDSIRNLINPDTKNTTALVVPVFETREYKFHYPRDKAELLRQLEMGTVSRFRETIWPQGQAATQYEKWKQASKPYEVQWERDYEPFIVTHGDVARYDERFVGFGWNKVEHMMLLAASGYKFHVLPEAYAVHKYHAASYDLSLHRQSRDYRSCVEDLKKQFTSELLKNNPKFRHKLVSTQLSVFSEIH